MKDGAFTGLKDDARERALARAWERFLSGDMRSQAKSAGAELDGEKITLPVMGRRCVIDPASRSITINGAELEPIASMLVVLYLAGAGDAGVTGKLISFRQLPGGDVFFAAFKKRVIDAIWELFPDRPEALMAAAGALGARKLRQGDASAQIEVFPRLPVTVILWKGDDEVSGSANVLFDESASRIMDTEDLAYVGSFVVSELAEARERP
ncbi:DUF3786 domain-containing protein [Methanomassiliicoccus luminyensis]|uniref:DUF3786 domain-containing protein n=1 Tax=Methanomassiliicoccus luminyensis TaxID=1080712 RepID=UPI000379AD9F|nr:DUF3786 domain-containing protein [Methanomassiliicoccus luminyensis]